MNEDKHIGPYAKDIMQQLGCSQQDATMVEDIMRQHIFHSTLDWQTKRQFQKGVVEAWQLLEEDRQMFEEYYAAMRKCLEETRTERVAAEAIHCVTKLIG